MAISGQQVIAVGLQNESANSDSLYTAFNKTVDNFATLFACASPYSTFIGNAGINANTNSNTNTITITNTGVLSLTAGDSSINLTGSNGNILITATGGGGNGGGVSSVGVASSTLSVSNSPIISAGNIVLNLTSTGITPGTYNNPTLGVDTYGRVTSIVNNTVAGTVTSVGITPGSGILVTNSPITSAGSITVTNTGVTRIAAGTGISVSGSNGNVTVSTTASGGTVTGITITSTTLTVTGGTITSSGVITVDLANTVSVTGNITGGNLITTGNAVVGGIKTNNYYYANGTPLDMQQPAGSNTQIQFNSANDFGASANLTFNTTTNTLSATNIAGILTTAAQANITSVGTLTSLSVSGNANVGNIDTGGLIVATGNITSSSGVFVGNGAGLTNINAGNITGAYGNSQVATFLNSYGSNTITTTGNISVGNIGATAGVFTTVTGSLTTAAQSNITSTGTLTSLSVSGNSNVGNIGTGVITATGNITGGNLNTTGILLLNSGEDLADAAAANLLVTASYFTTIAAETATLAAGAPGQIKTFMMNGYGGNMVITVTNPGWGGAGTITFSVVGSACTLQYVNSKWFCIGNNGTVFA
jgi:hypothetical protein